MYINKLGLGEPQTEYTSQFRKTVAISKGKVIPLQARCGPEGG